MLVNILIYALLGVNILVSLLLILLVLMQRPKSEGLGTAFGGGVTESLFGAQTSDVLTRATIVLGTIFLAATLCLAVLYSHRKTSSISEELFQATPVQQTQPSSSLAPTQNSNPSSLPQDESSSPASPTAPASEPPSSSEPATTNSTSPQPSGSAPSPTGSNGPH